MTTVQWIYIGIVVVFAIVIFFALAIRRANNVNARTWVNPKTGRVPNNPWPSRITGLALALVLLFAAFIWQPSFNFADASPAKGKGATTTTTTVPVVPQTIDVMKYKPCPLGIPKDEVNFTAKTDPAPGRYAVTPPLPKGDFDALIKALYGDKATHKVGYACENANVALALYQIVTGSNQLSDGSKPQDFNALANEYRKHHGSWMLSVQRSIKSFVNLTWFNNRVPEKKCVLDVNKKVTVNGKVVVKVMKKSHPCANFLVSNPDQDDPPILAQKIEPVDNGGFSGYAFPARANEGHTLSGIALEADHGWLTVPKNVKFPDAPICQPLGAPLFPSPQPASKPSGDKGSTPVVDSHSSGGHGGSTGHHTGASGGHGSSSSGGGSSSGSSGGSGCHTGCPGGSSSTGSSGGGCHHGCPGSGTTPGSNCTCGTAPPATCTCHPTPSTSPPATSPPGTSPPATTSSTTPTTHGPTTAPPTTTTRPVTTTTRPPSTTAPPTTHPPTTTPVTAPPTTPTSAPKPPAPSTTLDICREHPQFIGCT